MPVWLASVLLLICGACFVWLLVKAVREKKRALIILSVCAGAAMLVVIAYIALALLLVGGV
ncbi:MAG: hypothetical protein GXY05_15365 [Clostridiales bacterium]|nr:hypothetical protein [Clostridiales bacterium]